MARFDSLTLQRFWSKVDKNGPGGCWDWIGLRGYGYGTFWILGGYERAHRLSWEIETGENPGSMCVLHRCDRRCCVNPSHLFLGTPADNTADMFAKNREPRGEDHGMSLLSDQQVAAIRLSLDSTTVEAARHGVSRSTIYKVRQRQAWTHVLVDPAAEDIADAFRRAEARKLQGRRNGATI